MTEGKPLSGREAEVVAELETRGQMPQRGGIVIPWAALSPETRADAATDSAPGVSQQLASRPVMNALERFFDGSAAERFGVRALQVTGTPAFPEVTGGGGMSWVAEGAGSDSASISTTATTPQIHTATARYVMTRQATRQNPALESILRRDLSAIMRQGIDLTVFRGTGTGEEPAGLAAVLTAGRTAALTGKASFSAFLQRAVELQETAKLSDASGIRTAGAPIVAQTLADDLVSGTAVSAVDRLKGFGFAPLWSSQVSARGARDGTGKGASTVFFAAGEGYALMPTWGGVEVIIDPYSESKTGKVAITTFAFLDLLFQRTATHFFKLTAVQDRA
ncbi:MAG: phage major capsid protein [Gemmobacter sp.]